MVEMSEYDSVVIGMVSGYRYDESLSQDDRWFNEGAWNDADDSGSVDDDSPSPSHECVVCGTETYIESEPRKRTPNFCRKCGSVKTHVRIDE